MYNAESHTRLNDDQVRAVIRARRRDGLPCNAPTLRDAVGGGGTERLVRLLREVRAESPESDSRTLASAAPEATIPKDLEQRLEALRAALLENLTRVRAEERAASAATLAHAARVAQTRVDCLIDDEATATNNALELANALDTALARIQSLEATNAALRERACEVDVVRQQEAADAQTRWNTLDSAYQALLTRVIPPKAPRARRTRTTGPRTKRVAA